MRTPTIRTAFVGLIALLGAACADHSPTAPRFSTPAASVSDAAEAPALWRDQITGTTEDGAQYALFRPSVWNGDVVYYAHGIIDPALPIALPTADDAAAIRDGLGALGYAVAYSSYSENGYAFEDGLRQTRQLRVLVAQNFGGVRSSYLVGHSLGAQIVQALAEKSSGPYDGALALCGVLGGTKRQVQYIGNVRTLFDALYPTWFPVPGTDVMHTPVIDGNAVGGLAFVAMRSDGFQGLGALLRIDQVQVAGRTFNEQLTTVLNVLGYHVRGVNDFLARTNGEALYTTPTFTSGVLPTSLLTDLNARAAQYTATPSAEEWMRDNYEPTGKLRIPMLTLHKRHDRLVPFAHEDAYRTIVDQAGRGELLRQVTVEDYGHCEFGAARTLEAFQEMVAWASTTPKHSDEDSDELKRILVGVD